jgi:putative ABC transport system permease protein
MTALKMAWRNLGRNKRRSALAAASVCIAILLVVFLDGMTFGMLGSMTRNYTKNEAGHVNVTSAEYRSRERFMPVSEAMPDSGKVVRAIEARQSLKGKIDLVAERVRFGVVLSSPKGSKTALCVAGDPELEKRLLMLDRSVLPGGSYCDESGTAIVGEKLASELGLSVGDSLKILTQKADSGLGFKKLRVSGIFRSGVSGLDSSMFQMGLGDARDLLGLEGGATQVLVMLKDYRGADAAAKEIRSSLEGAGLWGLSVASWRSLGDVAKLIDMAQAVFVWVEVFVAFLGAFIIANIMMMIALERRREIGILKSMGMERKSILAIFLAEGTLMGFIGGLAGAALGLGLNLLLSAKGYDFSAAIAGLDYPIDNVIHPATSLARTAAFALLGGLVSAVMSYLPARGAARLECVEAIRSV